VVATHQDPLGLYLTVYALQEQMQEFPDEWEIIIAADGGSPTKWERLHNTRCLRITTGSPQGTRDAGIRSAKYSAVLCVESHVIVADIKRWLAQHIGKKAAISFPARVGETNELFTITNTNTNWDGDLWIKRHFNDSDTQGAYRVVQFGHAAFMLDRDWYLHSGGYTLEQKGWGGEEPYLCLKAWMTGRECWLFPDIWMAHYLKPGAHRDYRESADFQHNIDIVRYVMAGRIPPRGRALYMTPELQAERNKIVSGPFKGDLEKLREYFKKEGITT
jgi:hypothetical protein